MEASSAPAPPTCPECVRLRGLLQDALTQMAALQQQLRELQARLDQNASNSSLPPSANPPQAPKPVVKTPTGRPPGGQRGHPPHLRLRLPPQRLQHIEHFVPTACARCQTPLPQAAGPQDPEPSWHQVAELPPTAAVITEYQGHARTCPGCGFVTRAPIPATLRRHSLGPRLAATLSYLSGALHLSKRGIEELIETLFGVPVALGTISHLEEQMSQALAPAHAEARQAVRGAPVKHADETPWRQAGRGCWLWTAATATVAFFVLHARRSAVALTALLGEVVSGILCSDRYAVYDRVPLERRQLCWAHLKRDFQKWVDRGGPGAWIGEAGRTLTWIVFDLWYRFRGGGLDRAGLCAKMQVVRQQLQEILEAGCACADGKVARFCRQLRTVEAGLWTFVAHEGVEPTNNHAERLLRPAVLWRKGAFGCHSAGGCRFVERIVTVVQTLRLQKRPVLDYLYQALVAHRGGLPAPALLTTP